MIVDLTTDCCGGTGWYKKPVPFGHPDWGKLFVCECGRAGNPEQRRATLESELGGYAKCSFDTFLHDRACEPHDWNGVTYNPTEQKTALRIAVRKAQQYAQQPEGHLYIHGSFGAGKTHLAAAIGKACADRNLRVKYRNMPRLFDEMRQAVGDFGVDTLLQPLIGADILILDDFAAENASDFVSGRLFRLIDERIHKPVIITSNLDQQSLAERVGGRLQSRISMAKTIWLPVSDYRKHLR